MTHRDYMKEFNKRFRRLTVADTDKLIGLEHDINNYLEWNFTSVDDPDYLEAYELSRSVYKLAHC